MFLLAALLEYLVGVVLALITVAIGGQLVADVLAGFTPTDLEVFTSIALVLLLSCMLHPKLKQL
jgi:hypothetical protein